MKYLNFKLGLFIVAAGMLVASSTPGDVGKKQPVCSAKGIAKVQKNYKFFIGSNFNNQAVVSDYSTESLNAKKIIQYSYRVISSYPHSTAAFTQGLVFYQGNLFESTGKYGRSEIRKIDLNSGTIIHSVKLKREYFGEGLSVVGNQLVQLTWKSGRMFIYRPDNLQTIRELSIDGEGWGSASIEGKLLMSNGSADLQVVDIQQAKTLRKIQVKEHQLPIRGINEMEAVDGMIFANVWPTDCIAHFNPQTGQVVGWLDLTGLLPEHLRSSSSSVLNGIAYADKPGRLLVTGKNWPYLYEIEIFVQN